MLGLERVRKRSAIHTALKSITRIAVTKKSREKNDISYLLLLEMSVLVKSLYNSLNNLGIEWRVTSHTTTKSAFSSFSTLLSTAQICILGYIMAVLQTFSSIYDETRT